MRISRKGAGALAIILALAGCRATDEERAIEVSHNLFLAGAERDIKNGNVDAAIRKLDRAVALKPDHARSHFKLGNALVLRALQPDMSEGVREEYVTRALTHHRTALEMRPDSAQANYHVGRDLVLLGRPDEAIPHLEAAQAIDPHSPFIDAQLGNARRLMKNYEQAVQHYEAGLKKRAKPVATMQLHEGLAETYLAQAKRAAALAEFDVARRKATSQHHRKRIEKRIAEVKADSGR